MQTPVGSEKGGTRAGGHNMQLGGKEIAKNGTMNCGIPPQKRKASGEYID